MADFKNLTEGPEQFKRDIMRRFAQVVISVVLTALILFIAAGSIKWFYAWLFLVTTLLTIVYNALRLPPDLIAERGRKTENVEKWDPTLTKLMLIPWFGSFLIAGLDFRWGWPPELGAGGHLGGLAVYVLGNYLILRAMIVNHFFSTAVRIQPDRGHTVCSSGPYRYIRHPGYMGMIVYNLAAPLALGSLWALVPASLTAGLFVLRTRLEDEALLKKLPGYRQYAARTKYRLFPGVW